jgi:tripartite-type tricarboxylate transporter receptor subunit TctC
MSSISRRGFLGATAGASAATAMGMAGIRPAQAAFPERGLLVIVPYAAGGGSDISARLLARDLEPIFGKPVTVENRAGGGGWVGWGSLAGSKPDGYTIGYINVPNIFAGYLDKQSGGSRKENLESFTPLINHVTDYNMWSVKPDSKFKTVKDVIDEAKKRPGTITLNAGGHGTDDHVAALAIGANNGTSFQAVHFRGTPEGKTQVLGGTIELYACNVSEGAEDVRAGLIRPLGVMSEQRSKFMPNVPTFREQGINEVWSTSRGIEIIKGQAYAKFLKDNEQATKKNMNW